MSTLLTLGAMARYNKTKRIIYIPYVKRSDKEQKRKLTWKERKNCRREREKEKKDLISYT